MPPGNNYPLILIKPMPLPEYLTTTDPGDLAHDSEALFRFQSTPINQLLDQLGIRSRVLSHPVLMLDRALFHHWDILCNSGVFLLRAKNFRSWYLLMTEMIESARGELAGDLEGSSGSLLCQCGLRNLEFGGHISPKQKFVIKEKKTIIWIFFGLKEQILPI